MTIHQILLRFQGRYQRSAANLLFQRRVVMRSHAPYISFTFDDFPRSALHRGGEILGQFDLRATYYASFGIMEAETSSSKVFSPQDVSMLLSMGHELGCHTFSHCHAWETSPEAFENSIIRNRQALGKLAPGAAFSSFSYPISVPRPETKRRTAKHFRCCRCGGQTFNVGTIDLNLLKAYFLEKDRDDPRRVKEVIDNNSRHCGWLILATHDISDTPTPYGCTPSFFEEIVKYSVDSGAKILPVVEALDAVCAG